MLNNELSQVYSYNPIEYVKTRLKTPESIMQKLRKQGQRIPDRECSAGIHVHDIAGHPDRACSFFSEVYFPVGCDREAGQSGSDQHQRLHKQSKGKRLHELSYAAVHSGSARQMPRFQPKVELQIRTMAMDFWASLEHKIYYKYEGNAPGYF